MSTDTIVLIPVEDLHDSPFNPREVFHEADDLEMIADIKAHGRILQPLQVRPRLQPLFGKDPDAATGYEVVFGHRRKRNGIAAGLTHLPCMVSAIDDATARRMQISENLSRKDVHPMEEAKGFQALIDNDGETADTIAEKFGKSRSYVYGRLKLLEACPEIRKACLEGVIGSEVALLVARLRTDKLQSKALEYIRKDYRADLKDGGKKSYRAVRELLLEKFSLSLKRPMFDPEDAQLLPQAGACSTCPKRSCNAPEYADLLDAGLERPRYGSRPEAPGADICTDPDCFDAKKKAHLKARTAALTASGKTVIDGAKARAALSAHGEVKGAYIALKDVKDEVAKARKAAQRDAKVVPPLVVTILDPRTGRTVEAVRADDLTKAGVKLKKEAPKYASSNPHSWEEERREREERGKRETEQRIALLQRVHQAAAASPRQTGDLDILLWSLIDNLSDNYEEAAAVAKLWDLDPAQLHDKALTLTRDEKALMMLDCCMAANVVSNGWEGDHYKPELLLQAAELYGVPTEVVGTETPFTPFAAARAPKGAKGKAKGKKAAGAAQEQTNDAGVAGEVDGDDQRESESLEDADA